MLSPGIGDASLNCPSTFRHKSFGSLGSQRATGISPPERLGHREVEVLDEVQDTLPKIVNRTETGPLQQLANQDTEPDLDLIQPRSMLGGVDKTNTVTLVFQERLSGFH